MSLLSVPLALSGWKFETDVPKEKKYVLLAFPHTSNWDGLLLVTLTRRLGMRIRWMIKREWVDSPLGVALDRLGAVAVDRSGAHNLVQDMVDLFAKSDELVLAIPPEGTRKRADHWKSGFYRIALGAKVPVVPGYLDYSRKRAGLGPAIHLTGDAKADMDRIRAYYDTIGAKGRFPDHVGPMRLKDEG